MSTVRTSDIERAIAARFPLERAEEWDRNGLLAGDPQAVVSGVALALDPTAAAIDRAVALGANVLVTHHPAYLKPPEWFTPGRGPSGALFSAVSRGVALINAHTNLDRDAAAQALIPERLGLRVLKPLERAVQPSSLVTVFVPAAATERVIDAMTGAGAGRVGVYERCSFSAGGLGRFTPGAGASPSLGGVGERVEAEEVRVEMVCPASRVRGVVSAAVSAHPYEEPLIVASEVSIARNSARMGAICEPAAPTTVGELAVRAGSAYGVTPRVWGDAHGAVSRVATATGSAGSLIGDALASGAQAFVAGEVRYHDALEAAEAGLAVIEVGHDATEWPLVTLLEEAVRGVTGLDGSAVHLLPARVGWWTP